MLINWQFIREVGPLRWVLRYSVRQFRKRVLRRDCTLRLPTGLTMVLPRQSTSATEVYLTRANTDWGSEAIFTSFAVSTRDFLDIGSHIGYYAAYLSPRVRHVYAFEPNPRILPDLYRTSALSPNIEVIEMAVSSTDGTETFFAGAGTAVGSLENVGGDPVTVPVTTIDTFVSRHPGIDVGLIKTDIEGHDLEALRGMVATVARFQPLVLTECDDLQGLRALCRDWNYNIFGATRHTRSRKPAFLDFTLSISDLHPHKMLFLVPESLLPAFECISLC
jgi:FkbM family methyltransferase